MCICSALFRNLHFLKKALRLLGIPRKRTMGSVLFRNLHFLQKALRLLGIPRKRIDFFVEKVYRSEVMASFTYCDVHQCTMGSALFRNLRFLGIPRTLALAQVGAAISTMAHWGTVEMAAPTWARGLGLGLDRIQRV